MTVYKIPQDVEAEDKLLGPLTFKQFIFFLIAAFAGFFAWFLFQIQPVLALIPLPVILTFGGLAIFRREDQPMEQYLASFFNYLLKPRQRVWDPEGYYEHLIITAPKKKEEAQLKQNVREVHGQLEKLAQVIDTRGWAAKRTELTFPTQSNVLDSDDRLFIPEGASEPAEIYEADDILDDTSPGALNLDALIKTTSQRQRQSAIDQMRTHVQQADQPPDPAPQASPISSDSYVQFSHAQPEAEDQTNHKPDSAILDPADLEDLADLSISQVAAQVSRKRQSGQLQIGEEVSIRDAA